MRFRTTLFAAFCVCVAVSTANAAIIRDFNSGIGAVANDPAGAGANNTWYDITSDAFATPSAATLDGSPALKISDGGFTNGVYIRIPSIIPANGTYKLSARMKVVEPAAVPNGIRAYQMGAVVNGAHRGVNPSDLAAINPAAAGSGVANYVGLTTGDNNGLATQTITTDTFTASAGDALLIAFSTDVTSGNFDLNSAGWGTAPNDAHVLVDNLDLIQLIPPTINNLVIPNVNGSVPGSVGGTVTDDGTGTDPITWGGFSFANYVPAYGAPNTLAKIAEGTAEANGVATFNTGNQLFSWNTVGAPRGIYTWNVTATNEGGSDGGTITVHVVSVPEPATFALAGLALVGLALGAGRRKG